MPGPGRTPRAVLREVAEACGVPLKTLLSSSRSRRVSHARRIACLVLRAEGMSYPEIGKALGIHHTTALYACTPRPQEAEMITLHTSDAFYSEWQTHRMQALAEGKVKVALAARDDGLAQPYPTLPEVMLYRLWLRNVEVPGELRSGDYIVWDLLDDVVDVYTAKRIGEKRPRFKLEPRP